GSSNALAIVSLQGEGFRCGLKTVPRGCSYAATRTRSRELFWALTGLKCGHLCFWLVQHSYPGNAFNHRSIAASSATQRKCGSNNGEMVINGRKTACQWIFLSCDWRSLAGKAEEAGKKEACNR